MSCLLHPAAVPSPLQPRRATMAAGAATSQQLRISLQQRRGSALALVLAAAAVAAVVPRAARAGVRVLPASVLPPSPPWVTNRSADVRLDFSRADKAFRHPSPGVVRVRGRDTRVNFHIGYYHGNVAVVRYGERFVMAVRKMHFYKTLRSSLPNYPLSAKKGA